MRAYVNEILEIFSNYVASHHSDRTPMLEVDVDIIPTAQLDQSCPEVRQPQWALLTEPNLN